MNLFKRKTETAITPIVDAPITVAVPDIKDYLVKEYERVNELKLSTEKLEEDLELSRETKLKYEATLVTLDEYSKRLKNAENEIAKEKQKAAIFGLILSIFALLIIVGFVAICFITPLVTALAAGLAMTLPFLGSFEMMMSSPTFYC